jgi:hypothetical protein
MGDVTSQETPASFSEALRVAIKNRGVSLEYLRGRLSDLGTPLSVATLSYWRSGRSQPEHQTSLEALTSLEEILHLPDGHLRSRLRPSRRPGPIGGRMSLADVMGGDAVRETLVQLGFDPDASEALVETSTQVTVEIEADGRARSSVSRSVWKAVRDDARGTPIVLRIDGPGAAVPEFLARKGCRLGKTHTDVGAGVYGVELLLERPLHAGETAITELEIQIPQDAAADPFFELYLTRRLSEAMLWVHFDANRVPAHCEAYLEDPRHLGVQVRATMGTTSAHHVARNVGPGRLGIRWDW